MFEEKILSCKQKVTEIYDFFASVIQKTIKDDCFTVSASLAYTNLFALMPMLIVSYTVFSGFPEFSQFGPKIQQILFDNLVPEVANEVKEVAESFMKQASELSLTGFLGLLVVAVLMIFSIENEFNAIWEVKRRRNGLSAFLLYWSVITLIPILLAVVISFSSYVQALPVIAAASKWAVVIPMLVVMKFFMTAFCFALFYFAVPNRKVKLRYAMLGGMVAMILFEFSKYALIIYFAHFNYYKFLYGALAALPIFLVWLYVFWFILLLGAEVAQVASSYEGGAADH